jgi:acyl-CoA thioester hydrolase
MDSDRPYAGRFVGGEHRFAIRVYYEDTDAGGVVYHANYLRYFERARTDMLSLCGADIGRALETGEGNYVVAEAALKYRRSARLGDALVVASRLEEIRSATCLIQQRVMRDEAVIAEGRVTVAFVSSEGRPKRQPTHWIEAFRAATGG